MPRKSTNPQSLAPRSLSQTTRDKSIIEVVDKRIAEAEDAREIVLWVKVRDEVIQQEDAAESSRHARRMERWQLYLKYSFSLIVFGAGVYLLIHGFTFLAPLIIGASLFVLAPEFVMAYLTKGKGGKNE